MSSKEKPFSYIDSLIDNWKSGDDPVYECEHCKDKGYVKSTEDDYFMIDSDIETLEKIYLKKCSCTIKKEFEIGMNNSGMSAILDKVMNEEYETKYDWQKDYRKRSNDFVKNDDDKAFIISGQTGSGKTLLMGKTLLNLLNLGKEGFYFDWHNDFNKKIIDRYKVENWELIDYLCNVEVLYLDDLLKTRDNSIEDLYKRDKEIMIARTIIDKRLNHKGKKTLISMEWKPNDINEIDSSLYGRMLLLCGNNANWVVMNDKENRNIREQKFNNEF